MKGAEDMHLTHQNGLNSGGLCSVEAFSPQKIKVGVNNELELL